jgi:hypothetical protein
MTLCVRFLFGNLNLPGIPLNGAKERHKQYIHCYVNTLGINSEYRRDKNPKMTSLSLATLLLPLRITWIHLRKITSPQEKIELLKNLISARLPQNFHEEILCSMCPSW